MQKLILILFAAVLMVGCKATQTTTTTDNTTDKTRVEYRDRVSHDTVFVKDVERVYLKGDTIYKDVTKYKYIERVKVDTAIVLQCDTIRQYQNVYIDKYVTKYPYKWAFYALLAAIFAYFVIKLYNWANKIC